MIGCDVGFDTQLCQALDKGTDDKDAEIASSSVSTVSGVLASILGTPLVMGTCFGGCGQIGGRSDIAGHRSW